MYKELSTYYDQVKKKIANKIEQVAEQIGSDAADRTPLDTGDLRASYTVNPVTITRDIIRIDYGYNSPYAERQHEDVLRHVMLPPITRSFSYYADKETAKTYGLKYKKTSRSRRQKYNRGYRIATSMGLYKQYSAKFLERTIAENKKKYLKYIMETV